MSERFLQLEDIITRTKQLDADTDFYMIRLKTTRLMSDVRYYRLILDFIAEERRMLVQLARIKFGYIV